MHVYLSVVVMVPKMTHVSGIKCWNTDLALTARVFHLWNVPDCTNDVEEGSLLDEKVFRSCLSNFSY